MPAFFHFVDFWQNFDQTHAPNINSRDGPLIFMSSTIVQNLYQYELFFRFGSKTKGLIGGKQINAGAKPP